MEGNYSTTNLHERVAEALKHHAAYLDSTLTRFDAQKARRAARGIPVLAFCGMGRAGKDTAAEYFCSYNELVYAGSASNMVLPLIAHVIGLPEETVWLERHSHRQFWIEACHAIRGRDLTLLTRMALSKSDVVVGLRGRLEFDANVRSGLLDATVWIDSGVPDDPTVEYGASDCDVMIPNRGSRTELYAKLRKFTALLKQRFFTEGEG